MPTLKIRASRATNPAPNTGAGFFAIFRPIGRKTRKIFAVIFPQWFKTSIVTFIWLGLMIPWVSVTTLYERYGSGIMTGVGLALFAALGSHVWPTRTPPWRTVAFTGLLTVWLGATLLLAGLGQYALTISGLAGGAFILVRINENGRKVYRALMRRPLAQKMH